MFHPSNVPSQCKECKGTCWVEGNQPETQRKAKEMFGILPNPCVTGAQNAVRCPAVLGLL